jgi:hypothetical protein
MYFIVFQLLQKTIESILPCEIDNEVGISYKILKVDGQFQLILSYALGLVSKCAAGGGVRVRGSKSQ